jgi:Xaa-Pro dipeptidase
MRTEGERAGRLLNAQANAVALFDEVVARGVIVAGQGEQVVSDRIRDLANIAAVVQAILNGEPG